MNSVEDNWVKITECYSEVVFFSFQLIPLRMLRAITSPVAESIGAVWLEEEKALG